MADNLDINNYIGSHISKLATIYDTISPIYNSSSNQLKASQIFLRNPYGGSSNISQRDIEISRQYIIEHKIKLFIHTPYIINLSNPWTKNNSDKNGLGSLGLLKSDLEIANQLKCSGVVVHVGKHTKCTPQVGLAQMKQSIDKVLPYATEECPLLLETPAGQGTELCRLIDDFSNFYNLFNTDEKKKFKIVIDTAHVWASGYDPFDYITQWLSRQPIDTISLIHLNDSSKEKGSRVDRHAFVGTGLIGLEKMSQVIYWAINNNIAMVIE